MQIDRYTKLVLTVIAACLLWMCVMSTGRAVQAQQLPAASPSVAGWPPGAQPVVIVGWGNADSRGQYTVRFMTQGGVRRTDESIPVRSERPIPVTLPYSTETPIPARIVPSGDTPLPVQISSIRKSHDSWEPIRTQVEPAPTRGTPGGER